MAWKMRFLFIILYIKGGFMKSIIKILGLALLVIGLVAPAWALQLDAGESVTFSYDFSSSTPAPPYNDYEFYYSFIAMPGVGKVEDIFFDDLNDPIVSMWGGGDSGWSNDEPFTFIAGASGGTLRVVSSTIQYITIYVESGSISVEPVNYILSMSYNGIKTQQLTGTLVSGAEVPEPGTMLLVGSGLLGLWGFRRKFKK